MTAKDIESIIDSYKGCEPCILITDIRIRSIYFSMSYSIGGKTFFIFGYNGEFTKATKDIDYAISLYDRITSDFNIGIVWHSIIL